MVGRMEGQSVVLRAEKGKLRLMVDDEEGGGKQEMVYEVSAQEKSQDPIEREATDGKGREVEGGEQEGTEGFGYTAEEKCRAVLSVWTERCKPGDVCRELGVTWTLLSHWQSRAMEGMLLPFSHEHMRRKQ